MGDPDRIPLACHRRIRSGMQHLFENQRWMPYFHVNKNLSQWGQINKTKKKSTCNLSLLKPETWNISWISLIICEFSVFGVWRFKGGWVGIPPFFVRAALPTLLSLRSPTQTLGYLHGYSGSKSPENITQLKQSNVCYLCGDAKTRVAYQGQNIRPADFAPTLLRTRPRKREESLASSLLCMLSFHLSDWNSSLVFKWQLCSVATFDLRFRLRVRSRIRRMNNF